MAEDTPPSSILQINEPEDAPWSPNSSWNFDNLEEDDFKPEDPHALVHLIQCRACSRPYTNPRRLPCGRTLCQGCLPPTWPRTSITYPAIEGREEGFTCYWMEGASSGRPSLDPIQREHCVADCGPDIVLSSIAEVFQEELMWLASNEDIYDSGDDKNLTVQWRSYSRGGGLVVGSAQVGSQGWLRGLYQAASIGQLPYTAVDLQYEGGPAGGDHFRFAHLKERLRGELNCHICYSILLHPRTLPCGHTFCSHCARQVMEHSALCPVCRRSMAMMPKSGGRNITLSRLIDHLFFDEVMARRGASEEAEMTIDHKQVPLFICTLAFPLISSFFHIFEPRYQNMIREAITQNGEFGVIMPVLTRTSELGINVPFMKYGTLVKIDRCDMTADGRSFVKVTGVSRFQVVGYNIRYGLTIADTVKVEDISILEQERQEALETRNNTNADGETETTDLIDDDKRSTQDLIDLCRDFVIRSRLKNSQWISRDVLGPLENVPDDPVKLVWWMASVLPLGEADRYQILSKTSVRERAKLVVLWIRAMDAYEPPKPSKYILNLILPLLACIFVLLFTPLAPFIHKVFSYFPISFSASVSRAPVDRIQLLEQGELTSSDSDKPLEAHISTTLVAGAFIALFVVHIGMNFVHVLEFMRARPRPRRQDLRVLPTLQ